MIIRARAPLRLGLAEAAQMYHHIVICMVGTYLMQQLIDMHMP